MLSELKNNQSLSFYRPRVLSQICIEHDNGETDSQASLSNVVKNRKQLNIDSSTAMKSIMNVYVANQTGVTTTAFNKQYNDFLTNLNAKREVLQKRVAEGLASDPSYTGQRQEGVKLAWKYEKADVEMGGSGSSNWNKEQQNEILERGRVRGAEGHHINNVNDHPDQQADPDNINFYKSRDEHLQEGHNGDFSNESHGDNIDKNEMLKRTNGRRVIKNELTGLASAIAIAVGFSFTISFITELAKNGITAENATNAFIAAGKSGIEMGAVTAVSYSAGRLAAYGLEKAFGITAERMISQAAVGLLSIAVFSAYQFIKLKLKGLSTVEALSLTAKQALFSASMLAVCLIVGNLFGQPAALIVSLSIGTIVLLFNIVKTVKERHLEEKLRIFTIEQYYQKQLIKVGAPY